MSTSAIKNKAEIEFVVALKIFFENDMICLHLSDGREVRTPLEFYPRLARANKKDLMKYRFMGGGTGIHWETLDEDLSVDSIINGRKSFEFNP